MLALLDCHFPHPYASKAYQQDETLLLLQMVRCFEDENVIHVNGQIDSLADIDTINFELALADITQIEKRLERLAKTRAKTKEEEANNLVSSLIYPLFPSLPSIPNITTTQKRPKNHHRHCRATYISSDVMRPLTVSNCLSFHQLLDSRC